LQAEALQLLLFLALRESIQVNEFVGIDRVRRSEVQYRRVADGTMP
jgi:hypothetical protein